MRHFQIFVVLLAFANGNAAFASWSDREAAEFDVGQERITLSNDSLQRLQLKSTEYIVSSEMSGGEIRNGIQYCSEVITRRVCENVPEQVCADEETRVCDSDNVCRTVNRRTCWSEMRERCHDEHTYVNHGCTTEYFRDRIRYSSQAEISLNLKDERENGAPLDMRIALKGKDITLSLETELPDTLVYLKPGKLLEAAPGSNKYAGHYELVAMPSSRATDLRIRGLELSKKSMTVQLTGEAAPRIRPGALKIDLRVFRISDDATTFSKTLAPEDYILDQNGRMTIDLELLGVRYKVLRNYGATLTVSADQDLSKRDGLSLISKKPAPVQAIGRWRL